MKINIEELYKQYEEIQKQCIKDDYPIPFLINATLIPKEHKLSYYNIKQLKKQNVSNKLYFDKREQELEKINHKVNLETYWKNELQSFIKHYPQFKKIIMTEKETYNIILKSIEKEISKTHDGTNLFSDPNTEKSFDDFTKHCEKVKRQLADPLKHPRMRGFVLVVDGIYDKDGKPVRKGGDGKNDPRMKEDEFNEIKKENGVTDGHFIRYTNHNSYGNDSPFSRELRNNDSLPPLMDRDNIWRLAHVNADGEYLFRSVSEESESGFRISIVRSDDFDFKTNKYDSDLYVDDSQYKDRFQKFVNRYYNFSKSYHTDYDKAFDEIWDKKYKEYQKLDRWNSTPEEREKAYEKMCISTQKEALKQVGPYYSYLKDNGLFDDARRAGCRLMVSKTDRYDENKYFPEKDRRGF